MIELTSRTARLADRILDLEYGDEQERLRYYEAYAVTIHVQLIIVPLVAALAVVVFGSSAIAPALVVMGSVLAGVFLGLFHLRRHQVRVDLIAFSGPNRIYFALYLVTWGLFLVAAVLTAEPQSGFGRGFENGVIAGAVVCAVGFAIRMWRDGADDDLSAIDNEVD